MSCEGWSIGDRCQTVAAFKVIQRQMNGPDLVHELNLGDQGQVTDIIHSQPHHHWLTIFWQRIQKKLSIPEEQFRNIKRVY